MLRDSQTKNNKVRMVCSHAQISLERQTHLVDAIVSGKKGTDWLTHRNTILYKQYAEFSRFLSTQHTHITLKKYISKETNLRTKFEQTVVENILQCLYTIFSNYISSVESQKGIINIQWNIIE